MWKRWAYCSRRSTPSAHTAIMMSGISSFRELTTSQSASPASRASPFQCCTVAIGKGTETVLHIGPGQAASRCLKRLG
jgi:hypothetical protein